MESNKHKFSLRENVRLRLLKDMLSGLKINFPDVPNFILVVDTLTTRIVSSCAKMIELLEEGVVALERLDVTRKAFPRMHAIYFITPTESSIGSLIKDFSNPREPQYGNIHLFFSNHVDSALLDKMSKQRLLSERVATFKEINIDFLCPDANLFHFDMPDALPVIFSKPDLPPSKKMEEAIAYKLSTIIPTLFDYEKFHIIYNKNAANPVSERVAKILKERVNRFLELKKKQDEDVNDEPPAPIKIVILDRSFDPLTPILHDYSYQSMVTEFLELKGDMVEYETEDASGKKIKNTATLSDEDDLWAKYKHEFIGHAVMNVSREFEEFVANNKSSQVGSMDMSQLDLKTMSDIIKKMPMYKELMAKYTLHMNLLEQCKQAFTEKDLKELGEMEQCLATGIDGKGSDITNSKLIAMIATKLAGNSSKIDRNMKLRLLMIASIALELQERDRKALVQSLTEEDKELLTKLFWLGVDPAKFASKKGKPSKKLEEASTAARDKLRINISANLCRYTPIIESIANNIITSEKLDTEAYGSLYIPNNYDGSLGQKGRVMAATSNIKKGGKLGGGNSDERLQPKVVFFIIGGMAGAEMRVMSEYAKNNQQFNVIAGSTAIMKSSDYITGISKMFTKTQYDEAKMKN